MLRIRTFSLAAAALALGAVPALAADLSYNPSPLVTAPPGFTWTGPYLGAILGYGWSDFDVRNNLAPATPTAEGGKLGVYGGYNYDLGNNVVLGVEGDLNIDNVRGNYGFDGSVKQNWDGTLRGRAGYSFGRVMAYGTGGGAVSGATVSKGGYESDNTHWGWTLGAGVEAAVTDHVTARLEYQYADFGEQFYQTGPLTGQNVDLNTSTIRAGVGYKF